MKYPRFQIKEGQRIAITWNGKRIERTVWKGRSGALLINWKEDKESAHFLTECILIGLYTQAEFEKYEIILKKMRLRKKIVANAEHTR